MCIIRVYTLRFYNYFPFMLRSLVRPRPSWPGVSCRPAMQPPRAEAATTGEVAAQQNVQPGYQRQCRPFHSTAPSSIGFKNFKSSPRPKWKVCVRVSCVRLCVCACVQCSLSCKAALTCGDGWSLTRAESGLCDRSLFSGKQFEGRDVCNSSTAVTRNRYLCKMVPVLLLCCCAAVYQVYHNTACD